MEGQNVDETTEHAEVTLASTTSAPVTDSDKERKHKMAASSSVSVSQNVLDEGENFMTISPKEKAAWIKMIKTRHSSLVKREQEHKRWQDTMVQRRLEVYSKSKKLLNSQRDRFRFLFKMAEVVRHLSENKTNEGIHGDENETDANKNIIDNGGGSTADAQINDITKGDDSIPTILLKEPTQ